MNASMPANTQMLNAVLNVSGHTQTYGAATVGSGMETKVFPHHNRLPWGASIIAWITKWETTLA